MKIFWFVFLFISLGCNQNSKSQNNQKMESETVQYQAGEFEWQGHRGARGLFPENSFLGFLMAVKMGVKTLEMDLVVSADGQIVVSHEPWLSSKICRKPDGSSISESEERTLNIYQMDYALLRRYDFGTKGHPDFPNQKPVRSLKPLLSEVVKGAKSVAEENKLGEIKFNLELKSEPDWYGTYVPEPATFVKMVLAELERLEIENQVYLQSFDTNVLEEINKQNPNIPIAYLVENQDGFEENLKKLSFKPDVYSPDFELVTAELIQEAHAKNMKVIPWTVNEESDMVKLKNMGVDGIITDYPDKISKVEELTGK